MNIKMVAVDVDGTFVFVAVHPQKMPALQNILQRAVFGTVILAVGVCQSYNHARGAVLFPVFDAVCTRNRARRVRQANRRSDVCADAYRFAFGNQRLQL